MAKDSKGGINHRVKVGVTVKVLRGRFRGKTGKVIKRIGDRVLIEGVVRKTSKGEEKPVPIHDSKVEVVE